YNNFEEFVENNQITEENLCILTRYGEKIYSQIKYQNSQDDIYVMFGKESSGVPKEIIQEYRQNSFRIPMDSKMRSLNLSNCVALVGFELARQNNFEGLSFIET